jgi:hypothetical protein
MATASAALFASLEADFGAATLWGWTREWLDLVAVWDEIEAVDLETFLIERAGYAAEDRDRPDGR